MKILYWAGSMAVAAVIMAGCHSNEPPAFAGAEQTVQARVVESKQQQVTQVLRSTGTVHARESAVISAQVMVGFSRCWCVRATACVPDKPWCAR